MSVTVLIPHKRGSRDEWLKDAIGSIPHGVPYMVLENDGELANALNEGVRQATTEFVIRLDDDNLLDPDSVQKLLDAAWDVDVAYPDMVFVSDDLQYISTHETGEFGPNRLLVANYIDGGGAVIRRDAILDVGGYRDLEAWEDWDLWVRMIRAGKRFKAHPEAKHFYRWTEGTRNKTTAEQAATLKQQIVGDEPDLAATFYAQETVATAYWRCLLPARALPGQVVRHRPKVVIEDDLPAFPHHRGVAVWQFPGWEYERYAMAAMQEVGVRCLIESDDNYLNAIPYGKAWTRKMAGREQIRPSIELHRRIAGWCDGVIVTTDHLAAQYRKVTDAPVFVCPNQIDPSDWKNPVLPDWYDADKTYVGFAGSGSHMQDMRLVGQALEWASRRPNVEVLVMGSVASALRGFRFRHIPWTTDLSTYRALLKVLDIGLCPVVENPWSSSRSDLKILEYAMSGCASVVSDAIPYRGWVDGEFVLKAKDARGFLRQTQLLVNNREEREQLRDACRAHVLAERTMAANAWRWQRAVESREAIAA